MPSEVIYRLHGVSRLDKVRLGDSLGIDFEPEPVPDGTYGEPATFIMVATIAGIATVAAYLLKDRKRSDSFVEIEECRPDGSKTIKRIQLHTSEESAGKEIAEIVKQITGG